MSKRYISLFDQYIAIEHYKTITEDTNRRVMSFAVTWLPRPGPFLIFDKQTRAHLHQYFILIFIQLNQM